MAVAGPEVAADASGGDAETGGDLEEKPDLSLLAATGATGAVVGYWAASSLDLDIEGYGATIGATLGVYSLTQEVSAVVRKTARAVGKVALAVFGICGSVYKDSKLGSKLAGKVGSEVVEVIEMTSSAVTKGYIDSLPDQDEALRAELAAAKQELGELKASLAAVTKDFAEAQRKIKEQAEAAAFGAKARETAMELKTVKAAMAAKDSEVSRLSKDLEAQKAKFAQDIATEKSKFEKGLEAEKAKLERAVATAKAETQRIRSAAGSSADLEKNFQELYRASEALQGRVDQYETRLNAMTDENSQIKANYGLEIARMEEERTAMRDRIVVLEKEMATAEISFREEKAVLEKDFAARTAELEARAADADAQARLRAEEAAAAAQEAEAAAQELKQQQLEQEQLEEAAVAALVAAAEEEEEKKKVPEPEPEPGFYNDVAYDAEEARAVAAAEEVLMEPAVPAPEPAPAATASAASWSRSGLQKKTVKELRELCKAFNVPTTGKKADLVTKLLDAAAVAA